MRKVLVVDDEYDMTRAIKRSLEYEGHEVDICYSGREALNYLQNKVPDIIILDVMMPDIGGFDVLEFVRNQENLKNTYVLMISGIEPTHGTRARWNHFLQKPFSFRELKTILEKEVKI